MVVISLQVDAGNAEIYIHGKDKDKEVNISPLSISFSHSLHAV